MAKLLPRGRTTGKTRVKLGNIRAPSYLCHATGLNIESAGSSVQRYRSSCGVASGPFASRYEGPYISIYSYPMVQSESEGRSIPVGRTGAVVGTALRYSITKFLATKSEQRDVTIAPGGAG